MASPSLPSVAALTTTTNPASTFEGVRVKEERPDDAEINELAARMVEANKAKLAAASAVGTLGAASGRPVNILSYLKATKPPQQQPVEPQPPQPAAEKPPLDSTSQRGKFGWVMLGEENLPYILRGEDKYCAVKMVEMKLLAKYLNYLNADIYSCTCIRSYYITECEARLLSEINMKHCEFRFGREHFTTKDLVVRLQDASEFYNFLDLCYTKLMNPLSTTKERCGFIRINGDSVVPYTIKEGKQYVPLFYFEGETDNLKQKADRLESWDLAYLKFCCKVQGIRSELFASETCSVISLADIKSYFPQGTIFDEYWPPKVVDSQLLVTQKSAGVRGASWIKVPPGGVAPPPVTIAPAPPKETVDTRIVSACQMTNGWPGLVGGQQRYQQIPQTQQPPRIQSTPISSMHSNPTTHPTGNITRAYPGRVQPNMMGTQQAYYSSVNHTPGHTTMQMGSPNSHIVPQAQPPPLVRVTVANPTIGSSTYSSASMVLPHAGIPLMTNSMMPPPPHIQYQSHNNNNNSSQNKFPPPLIPVNGSNQRYYHNANSEVIDLSSPPQSPQRAILANGKQTVSSVPQQEADSAGWKKLIPILESPPRQNNHYPFKMQKALVSGKMVPCINAKPYIYSELLMTVNDLLEYFFPQVPISKCREVLQNVLQVNLYSGNLQQKTVLRDNNKCKTLNEVLPLIQLKDVVTYMPQMRYVMERTAITGESAAKRQRIS